ncbi:hypothetical protein BCIN_02g06010 [Botrytis cinerea B05.10]|uniref:Uncharacterized protein n=1 Tax=Botryotinia fuckeliana (strain B05.10) TaxID=332648 RepID=A0A384J9S4_BOTFB|nr:hypothetical protein BCIN_02g06010 [Botrytis cinerea B05.10]ATZ47309.1 hypothetical protein BCIN_02g06010 [Botrytis cinerea B05.10]
MLTLMAINQPTVGNPIPRDSKLIHLAMRSSSCEIMAVNGNPNGRLLDAKLTLRTLCHHLNQWESLQDVVIANPNLRLPWILEENQILLIFDAEPSEKSWSLFLPVQVSALQRKAKSVLRWVSSSIYTLVAKWKTSPASLPQKQTQPRKRKRKYQQHDIPMVISAERRRFKDRLPCNAIPITSPLP